MLKENRSITITAIAGTEFYAGCDGKDFCVDGCYAGNSGVSQYVTLAVNADDLDGLQPSATLATALVELFSADDYVQRMDAHSPEYLGLACALSKDRDAGIIKSEYLLPVDGKDPVVAVMSHVLLTEETPGLDAVQYIMQNVWTILNNMQPGRIKILIYDPYWDEGSVSGEARDAALKAGFKQVDGDNTALYLPKVQKEDVPL